MNRILKSLLVIAALGSTGAFAADTVTQVVTGNVGDAISLSATTPDRALTLVPGGTATDNVVLTVSSTGAFTITAAADSDTAKGTHNQNMSEWDGTAYVTSGSYLASPLQVSAAATFGTPVTTPAEISTSGVVIFTGDTSVQNGSVTANVHQPVQYTDVVLASNTYRMSITYTAAFTTLP